MSMIMLGKKYFRSFYFFLILSQDISRIYSTRKTLVMISPDSVNQKNSNSIKTRCKLRFSYVSRSQKDQLR